MSRLDLEVLALKHIDRAGWLRVGKDTPESVAAHSWGVAWLVLNHAPGHINVLRALELALVHDVPEVIVGDITPHDGISKDDKHGRELTAAKELFSEHGELFSRWQEYEQGTTPEARFVKECDCLDMALQAIRYRRDCGLDTDEFIDSARVHLRTSTLMRILDEAIQRGTDPEDR